MSRSRIATEANVAAGWITNYVKEADYSNREYVKKALEEGRRRRRIEEIRDESAVRAATAQTWDLP